MIGEPPLAGASKLTTKGRSAGSTVIVGASGVPLAVTDEVFEAALAPAALSTRSWTA